MKQYIDKAAVVAEIERRINNWTIRSKHSPEGQGKDTCTSRVTELNDLLSFLDTLEVKEEPVSEDLDEASVNYAATGKFLPNGKEMIDFQLEKAFKAGANWKEEQIMKDAIEREVKEDAGGYPYIDAIELYDYDNDKPLAKAGDKVKVLIIKDK